MKLYRRFLATYLCVCLIPLVFSLAQVVGMRQEIQRSIAKDQEVTLRTAQGDLESSLVEAANTLDLLSENELLESLSLEETVSSTALYDMCSLIPVLTVASQQRASYVSCFAYFPSSGYLVSNKSTYHPDLAGISTWDLNIQYQDLLAKLEESGVNASVRTIYSQDGQNGYLLISKNCYDSRYRTLHASLGILIQLDREESFLDTDSTKMFVLEADARCSAATQAARRSLPWQRERTAPKAECAFPGKPGSTRFIQEKASATCAMGFWCWKTPITARWSRC